MADESTTTDNATNDEQSGGGYDKGDSHDDALSKLKADAAAREAELRKLRDKEAKRKADEKKRADDDARKKAIEDGKAADALKEAQDKLAAQDAELERLRNAEAARIDKMLEALPEDHREKIASMRESMSSDAYVELIEYTSGLVAQSSGDDDNQQPTGNQMPAGVTPGGKVRRKEGRALMPETYDILKRMGVDPVHGERLVNDDGKLGQSLETFVSRRNEQKKTGTQLTRDFVDAINNKAG